MGQDLEPFPEIEKRYRDVLKESLAEFGIEPTVDIRSSVMKNKNLSNYSYEAEPTALGMIFLWPYYLMKRGEWNERLSSGQAVLDFEKEGNRIIVSSKGVFPSEFHPYGDNHERLKHEVLHTVSYIAKVEGVRRNDAARDFLLDKWLSYEDLEQLRDGKTCKGVGLEILDEKNEHDSCYLSGLVQRLSPRWFEEGFAYTHSKLSEKRVHSERNDAYECGVLELVMYSMLTVPALFIPPLFPAACYFGLSAWFNQNNIKAYLDNGIGIDRWKKIRENTDKSEQRRLLAFPPRFLDWAETLDTLDDYGIKL